MPDRSQTLTRTRCPGCGTVFRVTSEQLRLKAGKVRCGHCQLVFNAFDHLLVDPSPVPAEAGDFAVDDTKLPEFSPEPVPQRQEPVWAPAVTPTPVPESPPAIDEIALPRAEERRDPSVLPNETPEESAQAAREAGLAALRALEERPGFDRWSAGTLAAGGAGFGETQAEGPRWPYRVVAVLLSLLLLGQLAYHFRTDLSLRLPSLAMLFSVLNVEVPLPRDVALVSIESSDLQADKARKLFVLNATLKNRAHHAQAWPSLELTLTDVNDKVVARRVLDFADYLTESTPPAAFAARGEAAVRLWIDASDVPAAGYRLYIFYP